MGEIRYRLVAALFAAFVPQPRTRAGAESVHSVPVSYTKSFFVFGSRPRSSLFEEINAHLESQGLQLREGALRQAQRRLVDASIIEVPSSTKNQAGERDPETRQTKKGDQWRFGMKVHIGVDSETGVEHRIVTTAANASDVTEAFQLLHGGESRVWGDARYQEVHKRDENLERRVDWQVAMKPGRRRKLEPRSEEALSEQCKASVRAKVEHLFLKVKRLFGYTKSRSSCSKGCATGDWPRTGSVWRCCWDWATC